jgi:hypothetical protein
MPTKTLLSFHQLFGGRSVGHLNGGACVVDMDDEGAGTLQVNVAVALFVPEN